jgi:hypothetical protein
MRQDALRTLLVVADRPHPWAFLRDRLDSERVAVAWAAPPALDGALTALAPALWMVAGTGAGPLPAAARLRGRLLAWAWVGPPPADLPVRPAVHDDWRALAADAARGLSTRLAGVGLAPGLGLVLPDGTFRARTQELEALLGTHPAGIELAGPGAGAQRAARRAAAAIERLGLALNVVMDAGRIGLSARERVGAA